MKTRNGLFADVPENLWNDWHWQVANRAETVEDLKKYMNLTPDEEEGVRKTLGKLRMAVTPYYLSLIDLDDPFDPIRKMAIPRAEELEYGPVFPSAERIAFFLEGHPYLQPFLIGTGSWVYEIEHP